MPVSTCRLAHLSLPGSELHVGIRAEGSPRLEALARAPGTMVLFPGPEAVDVDQLPAPPETLIVVDGTWINARKLVERSPLLAALPRLGFTPPRPSTYRIRREPAAWALSTIEAVAFVLERLEQAPGRFTPILGAFDALVEHQLAFIGSPRAGRPTRHRRGPSPVERLVSGAAELVLVFVDAHAPSDAPDAPQTLEWVAERVADGASFRSHVHLSRRVSPHRSRSGPAPDRVEEDLPTAVARWQAFLPDDPVLVSWGPFPFGLLRAAGVDPGRTVDLKALVSDLVHRPTGGVEPLAEALGATLPTGRGRATRKLLALVRVVAALRTGGAAAIRLAQ